MDSDFTGPVNIGSDEMISINDLARMVIGISKKELTVKNISGPLGVRGRNSDNNLYLEKIGWRVSESLKSGMEKTFNWINKQVKAQSQQNVED
jgi:nucleoside-diphosphate-sugar epimerase